MNSIVAQKDHTRIAYALGLFPGLGVAMLLIGCSTAFAQSPTPPTDSTFSVRATQILGFEGAKRNARGTLSIRDEALQFYKSGQPPLQVKLASVQAVFVGGQSHQVGGLPMTLGKDAAPFGSGRVVSLFAHKKYDTLSLEYVDANGAVHGAIFQLNKGQGDAIRDQLVARGVRATDSEDQRKQKTTAEVPNESK